MTIRIDILVAAGTVLTLDANNTVITDGAIAISNGIIIAIGSRSAFAATYEARETLDCPTGIVLPGWVNTHTHLAMNVFRGTADDVTLEEFLARLVPAELSTVSADMIATGAKAGIAECVSGGTTTALDMYWYPQVTRRVAGQVGFRLINGPTFLSAVDMEGRDFDATLARAEEILKENRSQKPQENLWVMPHSTYTLDSDQLNRIAELASRYSARINTHLSESTGEIAAVDAMHHHRPLRVLQDAGLLRPGTVLAHGVHLTDTEISEIAAAGAYVAHCPVSNLKLGCGIARLPELLHAKVLVGLGTDGAASTGALDMFAAVRMAALLHKGTTGDPTMISAARAVRMGTVDGARTLGLSDVGTVETGMRADLQIVNTETLNTMPTRDPWSTVAYSASASDVVHTVIDGRIVMRDRVLQTIDETTVLHDLDTIATVAFDAIQHR